LKNKEIIDLNKYKYAPLTVELLNERKD